MKNVAVLYDIENLVGGYNLKYLSEVSLKNILVELKNINLSNIAIQKAYADWSNHKLNEIKWDVAELGIEPIQMYGFSKGNMKNAADIQLVIDAMEILYTKNFIDTFVIVSGDGGFSSLVKKISEYGKKVIGCAYKNTANSIFTKVCDDFIYIDNILTIDQINILNKIQLDENKKKSIIENPILKNILPKIKPLDSYDLNIIDENIKIFMKKLSDNSQANSILKKDGLNISIFKSALNYLFDDFDYVRFGFAKLSDFTRYVLRETNFQLILKEPSDYRILYKEKSIPGFLQIEYLYDKPKIHSQENYLKILASKQPTLRIPENMCDFFKVFNYLLENRNDFINIYYNDLFTELSILNIDEKQLLIILFLLKNTKNLLADNNLLPLKEQKFYFSPLSKKEGILNIEESIRNKLLILDGTIDKKELEKILVNFNEENVNCK